MRIAALTYAYNEAVNLPLWIAYYGRQFGPSHLYVLDHGSDDGSTSGLGAANVVRLPRTPFDDDSKSLVVSAFHSLLLQHFDTVVVCDCDEIVLPDPARYENLAQYIAAEKPVMTAGLGLQIHHVLDQEGPIDLARPILSQRRLAFFSVPASKPVIASVPAAWRAGGHACSFRPTLDPGLFVIHTKFMDYTHAVNRHSLNARNLWSASQEASGHGVHHRYALPRFVSEGFLSPMDVYSNGRVQPFDFRQEVEAMQAGLTQDKGMFRFGKAEAKFVAIPERFAPLF